MDKQLLKNPAASIVDVRTNEEFNESHYPGAKHIPLDQVEQRINEFKEMSTPVILYCRSGNRSGKAMEILKLNGITDVYNGGGLNDMINQ